VFRHAPDTRNDARHEAGASGEEMLRWSGVRRARWIGEARRRHERKSVEIDPGKLHYGVSGKCAARCAHRVAASGPRSIAAFAGDLGYSGRQDLFCIWRSSVISENEARQKQSQQNYGHGSKHRLALGLPFVGPYDQ